MSEIEDDNKTEDASEKKISEAIEKGQTPHSKEVSIFLLILVSLASIGTILPVQIEDIRIYLATTISNSHQIRIESGSDAAAVASSMFISTSQILLPLFLVLVLAALGSIATSMTPFPVPDRIKPEMSKISVVAGWKRIYSKKGLVEFLKSTAKLLLGITLVMIVAIQFLNQIVELPYQNSNALSSTIATALAQMLAALCGLMAVIATVDFFWSRYQWRQDLRMSKQEVKDEVKQTLGDPMVRAQQRSVARERARNRMMQAVPTATVVIVNPTHFSVALSYRQGKDPSPKVVAKGRDRIALRIREIAEKNGVAIVENVEVARGLYSSCEIDQYIPAGLYEAVAEIIVIVRKRAARTGTA